MSEYLTRLIERSLGVASQIEPLIAPLHAPSEQMLSERTETIAVSSAKIDSRERRTTPSEAASSRGQRQRFRDLPPLPEAPAGSPVAKGDDPSESRPRVPLRESSAPLTLEPLEPTSVPLSPPIISQGSIGVIVQPKITERSGPAEATEGPLQLSHGQNRIFVQPEIIGHRKSSAAASVAAPQLSSSEPPAIHVTIGRVEVRAIMAPVAPPKTAAPAPPRISLEEYLRQRNGGRS